MSQLYEDLTGLAITTTAAIWKMHANHIFPRNRVTPSGGYNLATEEAQPAQEADWEVDPIHGFGNPDIVEVVGVIGVIDDDDSEQPANQYAPSEASHSDENSADMATEDNYDWQEV